MQVERLIRLVLDFGQLSRMDRIKDGTGVLESERWSAYDGPGGGLGDLRATLASGGGASTNPAGVQQPCVRLVMRDLVRQHLGVTHGVESQEWLCEAG